VEISSVGEGASPPQPAHASKTAMAIDAARPDAGRH